MQVLFPAAGLAQGLQVDSLRMQEPQPVASLLCLSSLWFMPLTYQLGSESREA